MKTVIEPKFSINDLVASKWTNDHIIKGHANVPRFYEIISIRSETCSGGSQIFYSLRAFDITKVPYGKEDKKEFAIGPMHTNPEYVLLREDELVPFDITPYQAQTS